MQVSVRPVDAGRRADFFRVHCSANNSGWCNCVAWWTPTWEDWGERTADENRALRDRLFDEGNFDGYLMYVDGKAVGWCQCGRRDRLEKLRRSYKLESDPAVWAISCIEIAPAYRGKGLAHHFVREILAHLRESGIGIVQAFPRRGQNQEAGEVWTGPESVFQLAGFQIERDHDRRPVYTWRPAVAQQ